MSNEQTRMEGVPVSPSIHPHMLFATDVDADDCHNELFVKIAQARGIAGLLTGHVESVETPNNAINQAGWLLDEHLEAIKTIADLMFDKLREEIKAAVLTDSEAD